MKNNEILDIFKREIFCDKSSSSYLFYGDKRVDLLHYALEFSKMVMTKDVDSKEKELIIKQIEKHQYPDVQIINDNNQNIKIDEIREIIYLSGESTYNSKKKIFILSGIEQLRKESSNALLKILEEPPENVYFILLSRTLNLISTIKSRTIKFHLESPTYEELGVTKEEYYFFDGNEKYIKKWKEKNETLDKYKKKINNMSDALEYIISMKNYLNNELNVDDEIELVIGYNKGIEFICKNIKFFERIELFSLMNEIELEYKQDREKLMDLLNKFIISSRNLVDGDNLKKLIKFKNSIRNNVNVKSILFNFFEYLYN